MLDKFSMSAENFIKVIFMHEQNNCFDTKPGSIAKALGITSAAATDISVKKKLI